MNAMIRTTLFAIVLACVAVPSLASAQSADEILSRFDDEPTVLEVQEATLLYAGLDADSVQGWVTRANLANLLPEAVEVQWRYRERPEAITRTTLDVNALNETIGNEFREEERERSESEIRVRGRWDLSEVIFNPDVLRAAREAGRQSKLREDLLTTTTKLYYERRRLQVSLVIDPPKDASERLRKELQIQELTADIDALTGAWFSGELRRAGKNPY